jgi:hypothetical protein
MNWWPTFSNVLPAAIAAGVAIPSLLLLYFLKLRRRQVSVPSTLLWKKSVQDLQVNSPFQRLRRNLLLLLQMLLLIALLLALSNPITFYQPGAAENTVILIDRSASMNVRDVDGKSRLDEAKRRAIDLVENMPRGARAMVIAFDDSAQTVQTFTSDAPALRSAISDIRPTDRLGKLKLAYQLADAQGQFVENAGSAQSMQRVFLYSDGRVSDQRELALRGELLFESLGDPQSGNVAIVAMSGRRNFDRPTEVQVFARLANYGPTPVDADVQLSVSPIDPAKPSSDDFAIRQARTGLRLLPERWTDKQRQDAEQRGEGARSSVEFTLDISTAAVIKLEQMTKSGDMLPQDDIGMVVIPPPKVLSVALVTDGNYFLERAIRSLNLNKPAILTPSEWETNQPTDVDVVMFDRYVPRYRPASGNFIWFGAFPSDLALKQSVDDQKRGLFMNDVEVLDWKRDHPILRHLSLGKLFVAEAMRLDVPLQSDVLIDGTAGALAVLHREARSTHLLVGFDVLQSNWPLRISFPVFLHNSLQYIAFGSDLSVRESYRPGATPRIGRADLDKALAGAREIRLVTPSGNKTIPVPTTGDFAVPPLDLVGLYRFDPIVAQHERIAVNLLDDVESNIEPLSAAPGDIGQIVRTDAGRSQLQLWWWILAIIGVPLLMVEWWVYTRRVHA